MDLDLAVVEHTSIEREGDLDRRCIRKLQIGVAGSLAQAPQDHNPLGRPVTLSQMIVTRDTVPHGRNSCCRSSGFVAKST